MRTFVQNKIRIECLMVKTEHLLVIRLSHKCERILQTQAQYALFIDSLLTSADSTTGQKNIGRIYGGVFPSETKWLDSFSVKVPFLLSNRQI